ncbi:MAG: DUF2892 domain-containing protein [Bacteroidales bacterium]|nr:DUF2892 domain-containing protein [Bacteroidales bacterium]MBN2763272.1 DUF2892 domain-containing protein [Bacteroidales bacterium]
MKRNIGKTDRIMRLLIAAFIVILLFADILTGTPGLILLIMAAILVLTSFFNFCPLYRLFGISTWSGKE